MTRKQALYVWLTALFVAALIVADLIGGKFFRIGGRDLSVGMLAFPLTFVLTDVINEFYGAVGARRTTFVGLGAAIFAFVTINVALALPTSPESPIPAAVFEKAFASSSRLYIASLAAYVIGQLLDITVFGLLHRVTRHRLLWLRATGSTLVSQLMDSIVVTGVLLGGQKPVGFIAGVIRDSYVIKILIALGMTPVIYAIHALLGRVLDVDERPEPAAPL